MCLCTCSTASPSPCPEGTHLTRTVRTHWLLAHMSKLAAFAPLQIELPRANGDGAAPMETNDSAGGDGEGAAAAAAAELDFSRLKRQHLHADTPAERDKVAAQMESSVEETKALLERVAPNLKVGQRPGSSTARPLRMRIFS